ncbi:Arc family DNA-binding protein [Agrobacterium radiobacter]|uniref:Arc family DNA-binding protein n=1 Tax=Agrobacterium radiobacter TaxID=362 RepID=UPI0034654E0E
MAKQTDFIRYTIRVPREIYAAIERRAEENQRSVNAEVIQRLADSVQDDPPDGQKALRVFVEDETYSQLVDNLFVYDFNMAEYVNDIFKRELGRMRQYKDAYEELSDANEQIHALERQLEKLKSDEELYRELVSEYRHILHEKSALLKALSYRVLQFKDAVPADVSDVARDFLNADGLDDGDYASESTEIAEARYQAIMRQRSANSGQATKAPLKNRKKA